MGEFIHSQQVQFSQSKVGCGVLEAHHLPADTTGADMLFALVNQLYHKANGRPAAFIIFSDVMGKQNVSRGELLAQAITDMGYGSLFTSAPTINPKTGNVIKLWQWALDHVSIKDWYLKEAVERIEVA